MQITSKTNAKVKKWVKYHQKKYRMQDQRYLIEGLHLLEAAKNAGVLETIIVELGYPLPFTGYEVYEVSGEVMEKLRMHVSKEHYMGICRMQEAALCENVQRVILLDGLQDPGNVGTIIRTAYSFGFDAVVLSSNSVDLYGDKLIRSTQGALFHIPVFQNDLITVIAQLKKQNIPVYGTALRGGKGLSAFMPVKAVALVFGNEGNGVSEAVLNACDQNIFIEMESFESLNVAVAAGICMYHMRGNVHAS